MKRSKVLYGDFNLDIDYWNNFCGDSFIGDNIYDSLYIHRILGVKVFMCDHKSSNKYFNYTLDLAVKAKLYDTVYREIFNFRVISEENEIIKKELTYYYEYLNKIYAKNPQIKKNEYYFWLTKELISIERTLKNYVKAKEISESLIVDLEENNEIVNLLLVEDLLISICIEQSHFNEGIKHLNKFLKICEDNFTKLDEVQINDMYFKQIFKLDCRLSLSDTLSVNDFLPVENYYKEHKKENKIELAYLGYLKIRNALNKYDFSKNADNLIGLDKLFKEIERLGILDFITEEQYYPVKYIYSVYSKNQTIDNRNTSLNPVINLSYNIQNKNFLKGDSIILQMVKSAMNLNRFKGFSSEEILMSRNTNSGLIINALGNYFIENKYN
jgi:hypothetical protein